MNRVSVLILVMFLNITLARADVYVITNSSSNVYDVSSMPDAVIPSGYTRTILKGQNIQNLPIIPPYQNYNFSNGAFALNIAVVQAANVAQVETARIATLKSALRASALAKIASADGLTPSEVAAL